MEKYITDERTWLKYELVGNYYLVAGDDEPENLPIGIWGNGTCGILNCIAEQSTPSF